MREEVGKVHSKERRVRTSTGSAYAQRFRHRRRQIFDAHRRTDLPAGDPTSVEDERKIGTSSSNGRRGLSVSSDAAPTRTQHDDYIARALGKIRGLSGR